MKPTQSHYKLAQRIEDRRTGDRVADIDAIAQALAEAERGGMKRAARVAREPVITGCQIHIEACVDPMQAWDMGVDDAIDGVVHSILSTITDESE